MNTKLILASSLFVAVATCSATQPQSFETAWITAKPEVLTYRTTSKQGDGFYQISVWRSGRGIESYINIISPGFTKSVWGVMGADLQPRESKSRIVVSDQVMMTTDCSYKVASLHIATLMAPYNRVTENTLSFSNLVVDFSQIPLIPRALPLRLGAHFEFASLSPQSNSLVPLTIRVIGEETVLGTACYKLEGNDFEGRSVYWIEKVGRHRAMRVEQPERVTELISAPSGAPAPK